MKIKSLLIAACLGMSFLPSKVLAWADGGHKSIALIAWEKLDATEREWVVALLKQHPKYEEHFAKPMKEELKGEIDAATEQRWLFAQAAVWPDMVRPPRGSKDPNPNEQYHRPLWHYADIPVFPDQAAHDMMKSKDKEPPFDWKPGTAEFLEINLNGAQALKKAMYEIHDFTIPAPQRAVELCWLFHVLGDLHQPCHAAALFYPKKLWSGDRGGNGITVKNLPNRPLHAYWDDLIGSPGTTFNAASDNACAYLNDAALANKGEAGLAEKTVEGWVHESAAAAKQYVYSPAMLKAIGEGKSGGYSKGDQKFFSVFTDLAQEDLEKYQADAMAVAKERVVMAGMRLAQAVKTAATK